MNSLSTAVPLRLLSLISNGSRFLGSGCGSTTRRLAPSASRLMPTVRFVEHY